MVWFRITLLRTGEALANISPDSDLKIRAEVAPKNSKEKVIQLLDSFTKSFSHRLSDDLGFDKAVKKHTVDKATMKSEKVENNPVLIFA